MNSSLLTAYDPQKFTYQGEVQANEKQKKARHKVENDPPNLDHISPARESPFLMMMSLT